MCGKGEILGAPFMASPVLDLDIAVGAADPNVDSIALPFSLHSPPSPPLASPPYSAVGEPM